MNRQVPSSRPVAVSLDVSAVPAKAAGAGRYIVEVAKALDGRPELLLTIVARKSDLARWPEIAPSARLVSPVPKARPARLAYERALLGPFVRRLESPRIEVHHGPHYTMPSFVGAAARVVTIHDLTFFDHPEWHERAKVPIFREAIKRAARRAQAIICVSEVTAAHLERLLAPKCEVFVAPHGVDTAMFKPEAAPGDDEDALRRAGMDPSRSYIFHLGTLEPRKGITGLVEAFSSLAAGHDDLDLVLAGLPGWGAREVEAAVSRSPFSARVHALGFVGDDVVPALLRRATVVVYPSFEEGFGLPALEALACGARLVTTAGTVMAEVAGEAAWTCKQGDAAALCEAVSDAMSASSEAVRRRRSEGLERAAQFSWRKAADVHVAAYMHAREQKDRMDRASY